MPIDINSLRVDRGGDPEVVREAQRKRYKEKADELVDDVLALDVNCRDLATRIRITRTELNTLQKEVIAPLKRAKKQCDSEVAEAERLREDIKQLEDQFAKCEQERDEKVCKLGNAVDETVPVSQDEDEDNDVIRVWPKPDDLDLPCRLGKIQYTKPATKPLTHDDLLWRIGGYDPERGTKVAGGRGYFLRDTGVLLNQALINFAIAFLRKRGYSPIQVPLFMKKDLMSGIAQLADFDEQLYKVSTGKAGTADDPGDKYLIATSEQPLCAFHCNEQLDEQQLPFRYCGVSTCFRKEVGKANMDNRGIFRVHQFEKIEQFCITTGNLDESKRMHLEMLQCAEDFHKALGIPYRVVNIVSGELNDAAMIKYDLEGWFPGQAQYRELVSCSNCTDFQSRALNVRCRIHQVEQGKSTAHLEHVHMLNSTLTATGRGICCILETYQMPDGVRVPDALVPFMDGVTFLPFVRGPREVQGGGNAGAATTRTKLATPESAVGTATPERRMERPQPLEKASELTALEAKLFEFPYVNGFKPSQADVTALQDICKRHLDVATFPNIHRWQAHLNSFTILQRASWP